MELSNFYAARDSAPLYERGSYRDVSLSSRELGTLLFPSGLAGVSDPFIIMDNFLRFEIPTREGRVVSTVADVSVPQDGTHSREAYLSLIFSDEPPAALEPAVHLLGSRDELTDGNFYGIPVDAGAVSFFDADSMDRHLALTDPEAMEEQSEGWIDLLYGEDDELPYGAAIAQYPTGDGDAAIIFTQSGWGDGFYPVLQTLDSRGNLLGLHIDLQVVGKID